MKPLRIAVWHNLPSGGGKRQLYTHVQGLLERGHTVESWCPDSADQKYLPLGRLVTEHIVPLEGSVRDFQNPLRPLRATRQLLRGLQEHCRTCARAINAGGFDVLYAGACMFVRTTPIGGLVNLPSAIYLGEPFRWFYEAMPELPWIAPPPLARRARSWRTLRDRVAERSRLDSIRVQARAELEYVKGFDLVLANSIFSRETILRTYNVESRVCLLGVDSAYYRPTGEAREPFVVGLGTIYHAKGVDRAIRAVGAIPRARRPALVWVGNGAWEEELAGYRRLATSLGVDFVPKLHVPDAEVISLLSRATVMVFTSRLEPFGLAPLEANACGTPVVAIAEGGVRESIVDGVNGFLAPDDDPRRLAELIVRFIDDPGLAAGMGARAREHVRATWSLEAGTNAIESALRGLAAARRGQAGLADRARLVGLAPTNNVRFNIEERMVGRGRIRVSGWAHINDGRDATGSDIYILVRNASDAQLLRTVKVPRPDVTRHFGGERDYDDSGFRASGEIDVAAPHTIGILIVRSDETALQIL
jgi:glycosyltransferase involved in cell wall biosynthesis